MWVYFTPESIQQVLISELSVDRIQVPHHPGHYVISDVDSMESTFVCNRVRGE